MKDHLCKEANGWSDLQKQNNEINKDDGPVFFLRR